MNVEISMLSISINGKRVLIVSMVVVFTIDGYTPCNYLSIAFLSMVSMVINGGA